MEVYEYNLIALSPFFLVYIVIIIIGFVVKRKGKGREFVQFFAGNVFPEILKTKKDNGQFLVYLRQDKVLLEGDILTKVTRALFVISFTVICFAVGSFGQFALIEYSYTCHPGEDCFLWPIKSYYSAGRANCSEPLIVQGKTPVVCYRLVLNLELAVGVTYGMYRVCKVVLSVGVTLITKLNKNRIKCFQITSVMILIITVVLVIILTTVFKEHPSLRSSVDTIKLALTFGLVVVTATFFICYMPWESIIELKNNGRTSEIGVRNPANISA